MNIKKVGNKILVSYIVKKGETYRFQKGRKFESFTILKTPQVVSGFSNMCEDNYGILVIDYDNSNREVVEQDYSFIQDKFNLTQGYLFKTKSSGWHVVCLSKFLQSDIYNILHNTRCDENFKDMIVRNPYKSYILRISPKIKRNRPKFISLIGKSINNENNVSTAHYKLFNKLYSNIKHPKYSNLDNLNKIRIEVYETTK